MALLDRFKPSTLFRIGSASLLVGILGRWFLHPASVRLQDWVDGLSGVATGVAIGLLFLAAWRNGRRGGPADAGRGA